MHYHFYEKRYFPRRSGSLLATAEHMRYCIRKGYGRGSYVTNIDFRHRIKQETKDLDRVTKKSLQVLQPSDESSCSMLLVLNLAEPQWVQVPCSQPLLHTVICSKRRQEEVNILPQIHKLDCSKYAVLIQSTCYIFLKLSSDADIRKTSIQSCSRYSMVSSIIHNISLFQTIFTAIELKTLFLLSIHPLDVDRMNLFIFEKFWMKIERKQITIDNLPDGYVHHICERSAGEHHNIAKFGNIVQCRNGRFVSSYYFRSIDKECENVQDKMSITVGRSSTSCENSANGSIYLCSFLFYKFYKGGSKPFIDLDTLTRSIDRTTSAKFVKDRKDTSKYYRSNSKCSQPDHLPCKPDSSICFSFSSICVYRLSRHATLIPCKTGSHLQECRHFVCNLHFKCPGYYCIPWGYACDGKWDCPFGYDEKNCLQRHCYGMFKCVRSQICLHIGDVCDGHYDCPLEDDELMCKLVGTKCPEKCKCLNFGIICTNVSIDIRALSTLPHISMHVTNCNIKSIPKLNLKHDIIVLNLSKNSITNICAVKFMISLTVFDLSYNRIMLITKGCFDSLRRLMILRLQNNRLEQIEYKSFHNLTKVLIVDLSNNKNIYII